MGLFSSAPPVRRPVAEIVSGLSGMITELDEARDLAATEQVDNEAEIERLAQQRAVLVREQAQAGSVAGNLRGLLGMDLDNDGGEDDLLTAIASWQATKNLETPAANDDTE